jgi:hypothetical protein
MIQIKTLKSYADPLHYTDRCLWSSSKSLVAPQGSAKHSPKITDLTHTKPKVPEQIARQKAQAAADQGNDHLETQAQEEKQNEYVRRTTPLLTQTFGTENKFCCGIHFKTGGDAGPTQTKHDPNASTTFDFYYSQVYF